MEPINFFESVDYLEKPKCPNCGSEVEYGVSTKYDTKKEVHICRECGEELR